MDSFLKFAGCAAVEQDTRISELRSGVRSLLRATRDELGRAWQNGQERSGSSRTPRLGSIEIFQSSSFLQLKSSRPQRPILDIRK